MVALGNQIHFWKDLQTSVTVWASVTEDDKIEKRGKRIHFTHMHLNMLDQLWEEIVLGQTRINILKLTNIYIYIYIYIYVYIYDQYT
jgi:hypothetical protein